MRITVVGDALLDEDVDGTATRLTPDAPVPVVEVTSRVRRAGGAGLVATMLARDGVDVELVTALGQDPPARLLRDGLDGVRVVAGPSGAPTPVKTRLRANGHPLGRIDEGCAPPPRPRATTAMLAAIRDADALVVADYGRGLAAHPRIREALAARGAHVPLVWDPHPRGAVPVRTARLVTPNQAEAAGAAGVARDAVHRGGAIDALRRVWECGALAVTLGERGAVVSASAEADPVWIEARLVDAADPCGAGDRFAATAATELAAGADPIRAVRRAVDAATAYLERGGVASLEGPRADTTPARLAAAG